MADAFVGDKVDVTFGGTSLKGKVTAVSISDKASEPDVHDVTSSGDAEKQELIGMKGARRGNVTVSTFDEVGGVSPMKDLNVNDTDALVVYPEGNTSGKESLTWATAYFLGVDEKHGVSEPSTAEGAFFAVGAMVRGTVT